MHARLFHRPHLVARVIPWLAAVAAVLALAGCGGKTTGASAAQRPAPKPASTSPAPPATWYVSVGDSYAAGYQPTAQHQGHTTRNGFAYRLTGEAAAQGYHLRLANFGCDGATTESAIKKIGCPKDALGPGGRSYDNETQAQAALAFLKAHRGDIGLITVSLGGNDVTKCALAANPVGCVADAVQSVRTNLATFVQELRAAAGPAVPIRGITYPDVILGAYLQGSSGKQLATLSVTAFKTLINPALTKAYAAGDATLVDVTAATGAYGPMSRTTTLAPYGTLPVPVAKVCELTYFCEFQDIHPRTVGYQDIANLVLASLPRHAG